MWKPFELEGLGWLSPSCVPLPVLLSPDGGELGRSVEFAEIELFDWTSSFADGALSRALEGGIVDDIVCVLGVPWG
jgi:hypothetical protein